MEKNLQSGVVRKSGGRPDKAGFELIRIPRSVGIGRQRKVLEGKQKFQIVRFSNYQIRPREMTSFELRMAQKEDRAKAEKGEGIWKSPLSAGWSGEGLGLDEADFCFE
jgi:hypothetical protein